MAEKSILDIGIIGFGTVGTGLVSTLQDNAREIERRLGYPIRIKRIADLDTVTDRGVEVESGILSNDVDGLLTPNHEKVANFTLELAEYAEGYAKIRNPSVLSGAPYGVQNEQVNEIVDLSKIFSAQLRPYFLAAFMNTIGQTEIMGLNANAQKTRMINERAKFKKLIVAHTHTQLSL